MKRLHDARQEGWFRCIVLAMPTEVWLRNPYNYIRECVEAGVLRFAWDYGILRKRNIDPDKFADLFCGVEPWKALVIGEQGASLIDNDHTLDDPAAILPVWEYGNSAATLESLVTHNIVPEQEHRVVVIRSPDAKTVLGKQFYKMLRYLQQENPDTIIHVHGLYSFRYMFGLEYRSVDMEPREVARGGKVILPNGKEVTYEYAASEPHWVNLLGMKPHELKEPRYRCIFNIRSALWAGEHFTEAIKFKHKGFTHVDPDDPTKRPPHNKTIMVRRQPASEGDKYLCDICTLQTACKYFRTGAVCIVPDSEATELARFFASRDSGVIIDGLSSILQIGANRLEKAVKKEEVDEKLHPETTKILNSLFDRGRKLAMLVDPALARAGAPNTTNLTQINMAGAQTPQALMSQIMQAFSAQGIPAEQVTPEMIQSLLSDPEKLRQRAIEAAHEEARSA